MMGISLILRKKEVRKPQKQVTGGIQMFLSSFAVGITNPAAILTFLFAFSYFGITSQSGWSGGMQLVVGVFIGTYIWWGSLTAAVAFIKRKMGNHSFRHMNKVFGTVLILFSAVVFMKSFL